MSGIRTPLNSTPAFALGNGKWLKEVLRAGDLHYQGGRFPITTDYLDSVVQAYNEKAIKRVPFQLADVNNAHTQAPERRFGFIEGLRRNGDSLEAVIELQDEANRIVESDNSFPVSVLINHDRTTGEGKHFPAVLSHVLGTYDPVLTDLADWVRLPEEIAASNDGGGDVIDFLALATATEDAPSITDFSEAEVDAALAVLDDGAANLKGPVQLRPVATTTDSPSSDEGAPDPSEGTDMPSLADLLSNASEDELRDLRTKLDTLSPAENAVTEDDEVTDAEIEEALALVDLEPDEDDDTESAEDTDDESEPDDADASEAIAASHPVDDQLALANAKLSEQINAQGLELSQMRARVNESDWADRKTFYAQASVPGYLVDKAKPFLHGNDTSLKLSQSDKAQAAKLVDTLLLEFGGTLQRLGLAQGVVGTTEDTGQDEAAEEARRSGVASALAAHGAVPARRVTKPRA